MSYFDTIIADTPVGYWRCADPGSPFADEIGNNDMIIFSPGGMTFSQPSILPVGEGIACLNNAATPYVNGTLLTGGEYDAFTVEAWFEYDLTLSTVTRQIFAINTATSGSNWPLRLSVGSQSDRRLFINRLGEASGASVAQLDETKANHIVAVVDVPRRALYVNGVLFYEDFLGAAWAGGAADWYFWAAGGVNDVCEQYAQEFALYNRVLTPAEILSHYDAGAPSGPSPDPTPPVERQATLYRFTLTGAPDATTDLVMPISNASATLRTDGQDYLSVTIPAGSQYATEINARPNGELVLTWVGLNNDGSEVLTEVARVTLDTIREDRGARSDSVTLTGYSTVNYVDSSTRDIAGISYRAVSDGSLRYRAKLDPSVKPGMTAASNSESFLVDSLQLSVGRAREIMELAQADL